MRLASVRHRRHLPTPGAATWLLAVVVLTAPMAVAQVAKTSFKFDFGRAKAAPGYVHVPADAVYSKEPGYGFEPGAAFQGDKPFQFSVAVPEGNYRVDVVLGDQNSECTTIVKAESRRLMLERIHTARGKFVTRAFTVNVRSPKISTGGEVTLDTREAGIPTWDDKLTLEFSDTRPCVSAIQVRKAEDAITLFTMGNSTVTDQVGEPFGTWAQQLPRWFKPRVAVANHAESRETLKAFRTERRWDKVMSHLKPGDYVFMQFGHNDLNKTGHNAMWPGPEGDWSRTYSEANTDYKRLLQEYAAEVKRHGALPVIVSPMAKRDLVNGKSVNKLGDYPMAARAAALEAGIAFIDLNAMSARVDEALGDPLVQRAYVGDLHTTTYGGYLLSRCIVEGIRQNKLGLVKYLVDDAGRFDPAHPVPLPDDFKIPLEPRPAGPGRGRGGQ
jgi:lysophospholipase L1-like esterase